MNNDFDISINKRLKQIRKTLTLSQVEFSEKIHISHGYYADMELANRRVNDRIIKLVCSTYGVNEKWLKTEAGEMFININDQRMGRIIHLFTELKPEFQDYILQQIEHLLTLQDQVQNNHEDKTPAP